VLLPVTENPNRRGCRAPRNPAGFVVRYPQSTVKSDKVVALRENMCFPASGLEKQGINQALPLEEASRSLP
jgi:hypothetical protein